jgi:hypothetical protein
MVSNPSPKGIWGFTYNSAFAQLLFAFPQLIQGVEHGWPTNFLMAVTLMELI